MIAGNAHALTFLRTALALAALALAGPSAATTYHVVADTSATNCQPDGTCNVAAGTTSPTPTTQPWRTTATATFTSGTNSRVNRSVSTTGSFTSVGRVFAPVYASATAVSAPAVSLRLSSTATSDQFQVYIKDYDPSGAAGNGTTIFSSNAWTSTSTSTTAGVTVNFTMSGTGVTVPAGHRLMLEIYFRPGVSNDQARVWFNSSTNDSTFTVTEAAPPTTTVGDATASEPPTVAIGPGAAATAVDAFSLATNTGTDTVTGATVTITGAAGLASVSIQNTPACTMPTPYGSTSTPADGANAITLASVPAVTTTAATYYVCVTPKAATSMPATSATYTVTASVTGITATNATKTYADTGSATVTIDNQAPATPPSFGGTAGNNSVALTWTNPGDADYAQMVVLRWLGTPGVHVPLEGELDYAVGNVIGGVATVVCATTTPGTSCTDSTAANGSTYNYQAFARDGYGNYSAGRNAGPFTPTTGFTTTVGNSGAEPPGAAIYPGAAAIAVDAFTLQTSGSTDPVSSMTVTVPADSVGLESLSIQDVQACTMGTPIGTLSSVADGANVVPVTFTASTTLRTLYVCVKPKSHLLMPAVPGATYSITANVTAIASANAKAYGDASSATVTIDNRSPASPTAFSGTTGTNQVSLSWTNPADADFAAVVIYRWTGSAGSEVPGEGVTYVAGDPAGTATVVCVVAKPGTNCLDTGALGGSSYTYRAFARDTAGNHSGAVTAGPYAPAGASTTVGNGTDPASVTVAPGAVATALDAFTLQTNGANDTVTSVTVSIPSSSAALESISIQDTSACTMGTPLGTRSTLADGANAVTVSLTATSALSTYWVCATPKPQASLAAPPGSAFTVTGRVTAVASSFAKTYSDSTSATLTVDNLSPSNPGAFAASAGNGFVYLTWTNPADADLAEVVVVRWPNTVGAGTPTEGVAYSKGGAIGAGTVACVVAKPGASCIDNGVTNGSTYAYKAFARDASLNYSSGGVTAGPVTPAIVETITAVPNATATACTSVTVAAPFTGDADGDGTIAVSRSLTGAEPWTTVCGSVAGASPRSCVDGGASPNANNYYRVEFTDPDGVSGLNPRTASVSTPVCPDQLAVSAGTMPAGTTLAAGSVRTIVGRVVLTAGSGSVTVTSLAVQNLGTAIAGADVSSLGLYDDTSGTFLATSTWNAASARYVFGGQGIVVSAGSPVTVRVVLNVALTATAGRTFRMQVDAPADVGVVAPDLVGTATVTGHATAFTLQANTVLEGSTDTAAPMVSIIAPVKGATVSLAPAGSPGGAGFKVQMRVADPVAITAITSVELSTDNGATWLATPAPTRNTAHDSGSPTVTATTYDVVLSGLTPGPYVLRARVSNAAVSNVLSAAIPITVVREKTGDGNLLVRDNSSQLCTDCHALKTHSSESTGSAKGAWSTTCRDCHTPHRTRNVHLVNEQITPPAIAGAQAPRNVGFVKGSSSDGDSGAAGWDVANGRPSGTASYVNSDNSGPCQVCHTRTGSDVTPRWRNTGNSDTHYVGASTQACTNCHSHTEGFGGGESKGGRNCSSCHKPIWDGMTGRVAKGSRHGLGDGTAADFGRNDVPTDSGITWGSPLATSNAATARSCLNMCHSDHPHDVPATSTTHEHNAYRDATSSGSRAAGTRDTATKAKTDFDATAANGGLCASCHRNALSTGRPVVDKTAFSGSAHDYTSNTVAATTYTWTYTQHDGGVFQRNCTKCHSDGNDGAPGDTTQPFGAVHYSSNARLLTGTLTPNGAPDGYVCYGCHGSGVAGQGLDRSGKNVYAQVVKTYGHKVNADASHSTSEATATFNDGSYVGTKRHANCDDCHDPHAAGRTLRTYPASGPMNETRTNITTNGPLKGALGVQFLTPYPAIYATPTAANFSAPVAATKEYEVCFKCHSTFGLGPVYAQAGGSTYVTGTATFTNGSTTVTGSGTTWSTNLHAGWAIRNNANGVWYRVATVASATSITLDRAYTGTTASGSAYTLQVAALDVAQEFNPANASGHPVVTGLASYTGNGASNKSLTTGQMKAPWNSAANAGARSGVGYQTMACTDCHSGDAASPAVQGPHGSAVKFMLRGARTAWPPSTNSLSSTEYNNSFCSNCHTFTTSNSAHDNHTGRSSTQCYACHILVPHGGKLARLIGDRDSPNFPSRYAYQGNKANLQVTGFTKAAPGSYSTSNCGAQCDTGRHPTSNGADW